MFRYLLSAHRNPKWPTKMRPVSTRIKTFRHARTAIVMLALFGAELPGRLAVADTTESIWNAATTDWSAVGNWTPSAAPSSTVSAVFSAAFVNQPTLSGAATAQGIWDTGSTLTTGASGLTTISGAFGLTISGNATLDGIANAAILLDGAGNNSLTIASGVTGVTTTNSTSFLINNGGTLTIAAPLTIAAGTTLTLGNTLSTAAGNIVISGAIQNTSGGLTVSNVVGSTTGVTLTGANAYTGATTLSGGTLTLSGANGSISNSSGIVFSNRAGLTLNNSTNNTDRIGNSIAITSKGGVFSFTNLAGAVNYSESIGAVAVNSGALDVLTSQAALSQTSSLTIASLARSAGGTVLFSGTGLGATTRNSVSITSAGAGWSLSNGIVPWALMSDGAAYSFVGSTTGTLAAYTGYFTGAGSVAAWGSNTINARPATSLAPAGGEAYTLNSLTLDAGINLSQPSATGNMTITLGSNQLASIVQTGGVSVADKKSGGYQYIFSMATGTELIIDTIGTLTLRHGSAANSITWTGSASTSNSITKTGSGTLNLGDPAGTNDTAGYAVSTNMTGPFTINQGVVRINNNANVNVLAQAPSFSTQARSHWEAPRTLTSPAPRRLMATPRSRLISSHPGPLLEPIRSER